jgi:hypothetical protein
MSNKPFEVQRVCLVNHINSESENYIINLFFRYNRVYGD